MGSNVAFVDATHLVVENTAKQWIILDTKNGTTAPVAPQETFWCEVSTSNMYSVVGEKGVTGSASRTAAPVFRSCNAQGNPVNTLAPTTPATVGITVAGEFVWASPQGLKAVAVK
jgi:hypothetical protein